jgi:hypothetical protein
MALAEVVERFGQWPRLALLKLIVAPPQSGDRILEFAVVADAHQVAKNLDGHQHTFAVGVLDFNASFMRINSVPLFFRKFWSHGGIVAQTSIQQRPSARPIAAPLQPQSATP